MRDPEIRYVTEVVIKQPKGENSMNNTQWQTTLAPVISFFAGLLAAKIPWLDAGTWGQVLGGIVGLAATLWAGIATKQSSLISTVSNMDDVSSIKLAPSAPQALVSTTPANVTK
jgi:O-antigen/teichoic acid export membrane protein